MEKLVDTSTDQNMSLQKQTLLYKQDSSERDSQLNTQSSEIQNQKEREESKISQNEIDSYKEDKSECQVQNEFQILNESYYQDRIINLIEENLQLKQQIQNQDKEIKQQRDNNLTLKKEIQLINQQLTEQKAIAKQKDSDYTKTDENYQFTLSKLQKANEKIIIQQKQLEDIQKKYDELLSIYQSMQKQIQQQTVRKEIKNQSVQTQDEVQINQYQKVFENEYQSFIEQLRRHQRQKGDQKTEHIISQQTQNHTYQTLKEKTND